MAATYHHPRRLYIGTTAEMAAAAAELDVDGIGTDYWDTDAEALYIWDGTAWVSGFAAFPHDILSATHDDTTPAVVVRGDLMTGQGVAPTWTRLAHPGAANRVLQSTALEMGWSAQALILTGSLQIGAGTIIGGGGAIALGGATLTVPANGTCVLGGGAGAANRVAYWTDANTLSSDAGLTYNAATDSLTTGDYFTTDGGQFGIAGNELLTINAAGNFTFSGVGSVVVPHGCWVGADVNCAWMYDLTNSFVTTLDRVGIGIRLPLTKVHISDNVDAVTAMIVDNLSAGTSAYSSITMSTEGVTRISEFALTGQNHNVNWAEGDVLHIINRVGPTVFNTHGWVDATERMRITSTGVGIGTTTIPHGGVGAAKFAIDGPGVNIAGPHVQFTVATDDHPLLQMLMNAHDSVHLAFDSYFDYATWKSSDAGSNGMIEKAGDKLSMQYDSGIAQGGNITWNPGIVLDLTTGNVGIRTAPAASAILELSSTTGALLLPRMTTAQRNALGAVNGMVIYNTTTAAVEAYEAGAWGNL